MEIKTTHTQSEFSETTDIFGIVTLLHIQTGYKKISVDGLILYIFGKWSRMEVFKGGEMIFYKRGNEEILPKDIKERFEYVEEKFENALIGYPRTKEKQLQRAYSNPTMYYAHYRENREYKENRKDGEPPFPLSYQRKYSYSKKKFIDSYIKTREIWTETENKLIPLIAKHMISGEDIALFMQDSMDCIIDKIQFRRVSTRIHSLVRKTRKEDNRGTFDAKNFETMYKPFYLTTEQKEKIRKAFSKEYNGNNGDKYFLLGESR